jgi:hypothetical protein
LGISQALRRYVSATVEDRHKLAYLEVALGMWFVLGLLVVGVGFATRSVVGPVLFPGFDDQAALSFWTAVLVVGTIGGYLPTSWYMAERRVAIANTFALLNASGMLLFAFVVLGSGAVPVQLLAVQSLGMIVVSLVSMSAVVLGLRRRVKRRVAVREALRSLLNFGAPRGVSAFLDMLMLLVGPWLLRRELTEAGYLIIALALLRMAQTAIMPLSQVAGVATARLHGRGADEDIAQGTSLLFVAVLYATALFAAMGGPWLRPFAELWLSGSSLAHGVVNHGTILMWGLVPYTVFHALKGVVEMRWIAPKNLVTLAVAVGVQVAGGTMATVIGASSAWVSVAIVVSFWVLGIGTVLWARRFLPDMARIGLGRLGAGCLVVLGANLVAVGSMSWWAIAGALVTSLTVMWAALVWRPAPLVKDLGAFVLPPSQA